MFGLVVILNKKISYLHDELIQLRAELNRPYFMPTLTDDLRRVVHVGGKLAKKSPKKAATVKEAVITLKEALPDIDEAGAALRELETIRAAEVPSLVAGPSITMEDTFDLYDHSFLIPIERDDFVNDMFGAPVSLKIIYLFNFLLINRQYCLRIGFNM